MCMDFDGFEYELSHDAYQDPVRILWFNQGSSGATKLPPSREGELKRHIQWDLLWKNIQLGPGMSIWLGISQTPWPDGLFWRRSSLLWHTLTVEFSSPCRGVQQFPMFCKRGSCSVWAFLEDGLDRYPLQRERERERKSYAYICLVTYADTFFFHWSLFWFASHTGTSYSFLRAFCRVVQLVELNWSKIEFQE